MHENSPKLPTHLLIINSPTQSKHLLPFQVLKFSHRHGQSDRMILFTLFIDSSYTTDPAASIFQTFSFLSIYSLSNSPRSGLRLFRMDHKVFCFRLLFRDGDGWIGWSKIMNEFLFNTFPFCVNVVWLHIGLG